ncbi:MAG: formyltransferase family protein [Polyangiales bacterium]
MKILYLGLPLGALMLLREGHDLVGACISRPSMPGMRRLRRLMAERKAPLLGRPDLTSSLVQGLLATTDPELVVSWFWTRRIPSTVLALAARGGVNVHPSLLPRHRGPDPYFWTLALGDAETGVTAHWITADYDQGEVLTQRRMPVPEGVNAWQLARALDRPSLEALRDVVGAIERGEAHGIAQDEALATQAPHPSDDDCELLWDVPADEVLRRVRAAAPEPGAFTGFGDETVVVLSARKIHRSLRGLAPGDAVLVHDGVAVACADAQGVLLLDAVRESNGERLKGRDIARLFPGIATLEG